MVIGTILLIIGCVCGFIEHDYKAGFDYSLSADIIFFVGIILNIISNYENRR